MKKILQLKSIKISALFFIVLLISNKSYSHCEIPCGIYADNERFLEMFEHVKTIKKSTNKIIELSNNKKINYHDIVRWTTNKEEHATKIQNIVSQYFLTQRIKPINKDSSEEYKKQYKMNLSLLHLILTNAMKTKQNLAISEIENLNKSILNFKLYYSTNSDHKH